jgi:hypothetical protein
MAKNMFHMQGVEPKAGKGYRTIIMPDGSEAVVTIRGTVEEEASYQGQPAEKLGDYLFTRRSGILTQIPPADLAKVTVRPYVRVRGKEILASRVPARDGDQKVYVSYKPAATGQRKSSVAAELRQHLGLTGQGSRTPLLPTAKSAEAWANALEALTALAKHLGDFGQSEADLLTGKDTQYGEDGKLKAIGYKGLLNILTEGLEAHNWLAEQGYTRDDLEVNQRAMTLKRQLPDAKRSTAAISTLRKRAGK